MRTYHDFLNDIDDLHDLLEMTIHTDFLKFAKKIADKKGYSDKDKKKLNKEVLKILPKLDEKQTRILKILYRIKKLDFPVK